MVRYQWLENWLPIRSSYRQRPRRRRSQLNATSVVLENRTLLAASLVSGMTNIDTISAPGEVDTYTFEAEAGDSFTYTAAMVSLEILGMTPQVTIIDPNGETIYSQEGLLAVTASDTLSVSGTYTLKIQDGPTNGSNATGVYAHTLVLLSGSEQPLPNDEGELTSGSTQSNELNAGDIDVFTFDAVAGETVSYTLAKSSGDENFTPQISIVNPSGDVIYQAETSTALSFLQTLTETGTYSILVQDGTTNGGNGSGAYQHTLVKVPGTHTLPEDEGTLVSGETRTNEITAGDIDVFTFEAEAGTSISYNLAKVSGEFTPQVILISPNGEIIYNQDHLTGLNILMTLTETGLYTILVQDGPTNGSGEVGEYEHVLNFRDFDPNNTPATAKSLGTASLSTTRYGYLHQSDDRVDVYRFTISPDEVADVSILLSQFSENQTLRVYRVQGNTITSLVAESKLPGLQEESVNLTNLSAGDYLIEVVLDQAVPLGQDSYYQLQVEAQSRSRFIDTEPDNSPAQATWLGAASSDHVVDVSRASLLHRTTDRVDCYRFTIANEHTGNVVLQLNAFTANTTLRLYRLNGNTITSLIDQSQQPGLTTEIINREDLAAGDYLIEVVLSAEVPADQSSPYELNVLVEAESIYAESSPDNTPVQATPLGTASVDHPIDASRTSSLHRTIDRLDTYRFAIADGHAGDVQIQLSNLSANTTLRLYRLNGDQILSLVNQSVQAGVNNETIEMEDLAAGEYLIEVVLDAAVPADQATQYQLDVSVEAVLFYVDTEPDNSAAHATNLGTATSENLINTTRASLLQRTGDILDCYRFSVAENHVGNVSIQLRDFTANTNVRLYRLQGNTIASLTGQSVQAGLTAESIDLNDLTAGEYLIEVVMSSAVQAGQLTGYQLDVRVAAFLQNTNLEPNNSAAQATQLGTVSTTSSIEIGRTSQLHRTNDRLDCYRFAVAAGTTASGSVELSAFSTDLTLRIYRLEGDVIVGLAGQSKNSGTAAESITLNELAAGDYLIEVVIDSAVLADQATGYALWVNLHGNLA